MSQNLILHLPTKFQKDHTINKLDVDHQRDDDASLMSSYGCMLRPTCMFMDRMIAPINVHSSYELKIVYKNMTAENFIRTFATLIK